MLKGTKANSLANCSLNNNNFVTIALVTVNRNIARKLMEANISGNRNNVVKILDQKYFLFLQLFLVVLATFTGSYHYMPR